MAPKQLYSSVNQKNGTRTRLWRSIACRRPATILELFPRPFRKQFYRDGRSQLRVLDSISTTVRKGHPEIAGPFSGVAPTHTPKDRFHRTQRHPEDRSWASAPARDFDPYLKRPLSSVRSIAPSHSLPSPEIRTTPRPAVCESGFDPRRDDKVPGC